jgi:hypothetical protein
VGAELPDLLAAQERLLALSDRNLVPDEFGRIPTSGVPVAGFFLKEDLMTTITAFIKRHPVLTYYALAFALS